MEFQEPSEWDNRQLEKCQRELASIMDKYNAKFVPSMTFMPDGSVDVRVGVMLLKQKSNIVVPNFNPPKNVGGA